MTDPIRFSHLRAYGRSALHGHFARAGGEDAETAAMERGTAVHHIVFGTKRVVAYPARRAGKDYEAFAAAHSDCEIMTVDGYDKASRMADAVRTCELAAPFLRGIVEETLLFKWNGLDCRSTPDVRGRGFVTELKTTANADPQRFVWDALKRCYHGQMRFEQMAAQANGFQIEDCYVVAVESAEPYPVTVYRMTDRALEVGDKLLMLWAERLKNCEASNEFPPYAQSICEIDVPDEQVFEFEEVV